jgi:hypothetical protein
VVCDLEGLLETLEALAEGREWYAAPIRPGLRGQIDSMDNMARIVRVWKGYGTADGVRQYCDHHFTKTVLPQLRALEGFLSANVLVRSIETETEVIVATVWDSIDSVKAFAGEDHNVAVVEPIVRDLLDRFDDRVTHFTVAVAT